MGCGGSKEDTSGRERNDAIEAQLKKDKMNLRNEIKMCVIRMSSLSLSMRLQPSAALGEVPSRAGAAKRARPPPVSRGRTVTSAQADRAIYFSQLQAAARCRGVGQVHRSQTDEAHP